ncbi:MAG TPA: hypothetical protein VKY92_03070 [Verrucomicrobiae bacterium]|nr:hypothetical protein [Verrucomicrobiae bacterium]
MHYENRPYRSAAPELELIFKAGYPYKPGMIQSVKSWRLVFGLLAAGTVILLAGLWWRAASNYRRELIRLSPREIRRISLQNETSSGGELHIREVELNVVERERFLQLIAATTPCSMNHPRGGSSCVARIWSESNRPKFEFTIHVGSTGGTYIALFSNGLGGWSYGTFRNDALETFVGQVLAKPGGKVETYQLPH